VGRFELAANGTLFLDEIADLPQQLQVKLLRVLQEHQYERVGESETRIASARIIAATNVDLHEALRQGRLREDLYYRLCVVPIEVPPLRERREDISPLALHLLSCITSQRGLVRRVSPQAMRLLLDYGWPGNVRELANVIEYAVVVSRRETILPEDLPLEIRQISHPVSASSPNAAPGSNGGAATLPEAADREVERLLAALEKHHWKRADAARELGLSRSTLWRRMRELRME
jgi:DNA-binding NtrC family response regulator